MTPWTAPEIAVLEALWPREDISGDDMVAHIGRSKGSVWDKAKRLKLGQRPECRRAVGARRSHSRRARPADQVYVSMNGGGPPLIALTDKHCKFPLGPLLEPSDTYCGAERVTGRPYCDHHARIAYRPAVAPDG